MKKKQQKQQEKWCKHPEIKRTYTKGKIIIIKLK